MSILATTNVVVEHTTVSKPLVNVENVNEFATLVTASMTKMTLMRTEKISSVNLVKNLTMLDAEVTDATKRSKEVQSPVQA